MSNVLYHYCSAEKFLSIVSNRAVRLSALSLSNDSMEGRWSQKVFADACKEVWRGTTLEIVEQASAKLPDYYGGLGFCLSERGDQLSQWRGYADDGQGFCIGFDTSRMSPLFEKETFGGQPCQLVKVEYRNEQQRIRMTELVAGIKLRSKITPPAHIADDEKKVQREITKFSELLIKQVDNDLLPHLYTMKNSAFKEEAEWRWVSTYALSSDTSRLFYQAGKNKISPYIEVKWDILESPIAAVVIGPKNITPESIVKGFVGQYAGNVKVSLSRATYR